MRVEPVAETSGIRRSAASFRPIEGPSPITRDNNAGSAPFCFQFAQGVPELTHGFAADWSRRNAPFLEGLLGACDRLLVFGVCRRPDTRQKFAVDRRKFFDDWSTASPIAVEDAGIFRADSELI